MTSSEALIFLIGVLNVFLIGLFLGDKVLFILGRDARVYNSCFEWIVDVHCPVEIRHLTILRPRIVPFKSFQTNNLILNGHLNNKPFYRHAQLCTQLSDAHITELTKIKIYNSDIITIFSVKFVDQVFNDMFFILLEKVLNYHVNSHMRWFE